MRKWCPEPFDENRGQDRPGEDPLVSFETVSPSIAPFHENHAAENPRFEKDHGLKDRQSFWDLIDEVDKDQLLERARDKLQVEFDTREMELRRRHQEELAEIRNEFVQKLDNWCRELAAGQDLQRQGIATQAAGLALALARKIIRDTVEVDPGFVTRTLETALFKVRDSNPLTVILHPDDANLLNDNPDLMSGLRIGTVVSDRRVEKGGCLVRAGVREWDATLARQMDFLSEIVEEALAASSTRVSSNPGEDDDSGLD
jgi:flagellar biosynthesis/type III secretory pathway protein FliH